MLCFLHLHTTRTQSVLTGPLFFCLFFLCPFTAQNFRGLVVGAGGGLSNVIHTCAEKTNYLFTWQFCKLFKTIQAKSTWPLWENTTDDHSVTFMSILQIHMTFHRHVPRPIIYMTVLQNLHDHYAYIHMTIMKNTDDHSIKSAWLHKSTSAFCKSTWERLHNGAYWV